MDVLPLPVSVPASLHLCPASPTDMMMKALPVLLRETAALRSPRLANSGTRIQTQVSPGTEFIHVSASPHGTVLLWERLKPQCVGGGYHC